MTIKIDEDFMCLEIDGTVVATARKRADGLVGSQLLAAVL
jgi:hypothetical protein